jgi:hypothetical protein
MARILLIEQALGPAIPIGSHSQASEMNDCRITEAERRGIGENDDLFLIGPIQKADVLNANHRIYGMSVLRPADEKYWQRYGRGSMNAGGELGHPEGPDLDINQLSHCLMDSWWQGTELMGKLKVLHNRPGQEIRALVLRDGYHPGISSRGMGSLRRSPEGYHIVQEDLEIVCYDLVATPSTPGAYMKPVSGTMFESASLPDLTDTASTMEKVIGLTKFFRTIR